MAAGSTACDGDLRAMHRVPGEVAVQSRRSNRTHPMPSVLACANTGQGGALPDDFGPRTRVLRQIQGTCD